MGILNPICMKFNETLDYLRDHPNDTRFSLLIVDMDFDKTEPGIYSTCVATSHLILKQITIDHPWVGDIPTLCVVDNRMKRSRKRVSKELEATFSSSAIQHPQGSRNPVPTPQEEQANPFDVTSTPQSPSAALLSKSLENSLNDKLHTSITKPFKNSKLIHMLHDLLLTGQGLQPGLRKHRLGSLSSASTKRSFKGNRSTNSSRRQSQNSASHSGTEEEDHGIHDLGSIKTLVVDDNPVNLKVLSRMLNQIGISSTTASNGREAFEAVKAASTTSEPYQLVFMDIWMPELNGLEASQKIREHVSTSSNKPYIIALTACVMPGDREKCMEAGMNGYVSKPIRKEELEASIHTFTQTVSNDDGADVKK
jgi:CheY-like chemotaxis protein